MFGPTYAQIKWAVQQGRQATVNKLFEDLPLPAPPVNAYYTDDPGVPIGATWVNAVYPGINMVAERSYRGRSLTLLAGGQLLGGRHVHPPKADALLAQPLPHRGDIGCQTALQLLPPAEQLRLGQLPGADQSHDDRPRDAELSSMATATPTSAPNENYARELLELFTIGKGPAVGPGDYTNYTEHDVMEIARALTGWRDFGSNATSGDGAVGANFNPNQHDTGTKTLSYRFNNAVIPNLGEQEYAHVIDIVFQQDEVARYICRRLYQWFVYYEITEEAEVNVIEPMAQILDQQRLPDQACLDGFAV
jgi:hypothetical protein